MEFLERFTSLTFGDLSFGNPSLLRYAGDDVEDQAKRHHWRIFSLKYDTSTWIVSSAGNLHTGGVRGGKGGCAALLNIINVCGIYRATTLLFGVPELVRLFQRHMICLYFVDVCKFFPGQPGKACIHGVLQLHLLPPVGVVRCRPLSLLLP